MRLSAALVLLIVPTSAFVVPARQWGSAASSSLRMSSTYDAILEAAPTADVETFKNKLEENRAKMAEKDLTSKALSKEVSKELFKSFFHRYYGSSDGYKFLRG